MYTVSDHPLPDVFSTAELARATRTSVAGVQAWIEAGAIRALPVGDGVSWLTRGEAVRAGRATLDGTIAAGVTAIGPREDRLFASRTTSVGPRLGRPLAVSGSAHLALVATIILITTLGLGRATATTESPVDPVPFRLVYLAIPGPGGGGGGGGLKQVIPPPKAQRKGAAHIDSPLPATQPLPQVDPPKPDPPPVAPEPPIEAPVVAAPANDRDRPGVIESTPAKIESRGPGDAGGVGSGAGTGIGEGKGAGIGEGEGGGTGGGPYRPGSGIEPPRVLREVKPDYTEDARRRNIRGEVVMEIVVKRDGSVSDIRVLQGLGYGLDERAIDAVRQWRFSPATRKGIPVDVMVEVAMEFKLR